MVLAIFDLSGIQKFIFSTNKLKDIIGASAVVNNALFKNIPEMCNDVENNWKTDCFNFSSGDESKIVYIGGGNALLMFKDENVYNAFARELTEKVFLQSGGAIRLFSACVELDEAATLSENQKLLMEKLDSAKKAGGSITPSLCLPITAYDNNNYEPLVVKTINNKTVYAPRSKFAKSEGLSASKGIFKDIVDTDEISFMTEFDKLESSGNKSFVAIIHIDGNTMGIKIREFVQNLKCDVKQALDEMKKLSVEIGELYKSVLKETIENMYSSASGEIPFRPIVADGDDITVILESSRAFEFTEKFMEYLQKKSLKCFGGYTPTAAAGIAFVKTSFPFSTGYDIAEQCCKNAKKETLDRYNMGSACSVDYQVCYSNIHNTVEEFRKENYVVDDATLIRRPYIFNDENEYSYSEFKNMCEKLNAGLKNNTIARSKLKGLRNAYSISRLEAESYGNYIDAHAMGSEQRELSSWLKKPFNDKDEGLFFDYLDVMDVL